MVIVESHQTYSELVELIKSDDFILIPVFYDTKIHPIINKISLLYFHFIKLNITYIIPVNHPDCINMNTGDYDKIEVYIVATRAKKIVVDKRDMQHYMGFQLDETWIDIQLLDYIDNGKLNVDFQEYTPAHQFLHRRAFKSSEINLIIPLTKHIEYLEDNKNKILEIIKNSFYLESHTFNIMNTVLLDTLYNIESAGIKVNGELLSKEFVHNGLAYYKYNPYTATNRPSCAYRGFNFIGLSKEDGSRKQFISRFGDNGMLLLIDYEACHFHLLSQLIDEKFDDNPYTVLGKLYFNKQELTAEEHDQAKQLSFNVIYGNIPDEFLNIPFFQKVKDFRNELYEAYKSNGYIETYYFKRKIYSHTTGSTTPNKLFNYYMQAIETESHMLILNELFKQIKEYETKIILYIYDSILIDFKISEGKELVDKIVDILQQDNKFPVSVSWGTNYHQMSKLS